MGKLDCTLELSEAFEGVHNEFVIKTYFIYDKSPPHPFVKKPVGRCILVVLLSFSFILSEKYLSKYSELLCERYANLY